MTEWESFYVILGSAGAALTGLMFVAVALLADDSIEVRASELQLNAFATPTVVHFSAVVVQSLLLTAPWPTLSAARYAVAAYAMAGVIYMLVVIRRATTQTLYEMVLEDWVFYVALPLVAYLMALTAAGALLRYPTVSLFVI